MYTTLRATIYLIAHCVQISFTTTPAVVVQYQHPSCSDDPTVKWDDRLLIGVLDILDFSPSTLEFVREFDKQWKICEFRF